MNRHFCWGTLSDDRLGLKVSHLEVMLVLWLLRFVAAAAAAAAAACRR